MSFKSWRSYQHFNYAVKNTSRYILNQESRDFLDAIKHTCPSRRTIVPIDSQLWRAQAGSDERPLIQHEEHVDDLPVPFTEARMRPLRYCSSEGRANSKGIPCLYVASNKHTAKSEIRPLLGSLISLAKFVNNRELRIIDFSIHHERPKPFYFEEPSEQKRTESVWIDIDNAFSEPVTNSDQTSDYAPTQIIAELIKSLGYDGIAYKSSLGDGHNLALFDLDCVDYVGSGLFKTKKINIEFDRIANQFNEPEAF